MATYKIGITGGISSGKSFVSQYFKNKNYTVIDADSLVAETYQEKSFHKKIKSVLKNFEGEVNKESMKKYLEKNPRDLGVLESIIHPILHEKFLKLADKTKSLFFYEATLILEKNMLDRFDYCLVCLCPEEIRQKRFMKRPNASLEKFQFFTRHQVPDDEREKLCKSEKKLVSIDTSKTEDFTIEQLENFLPKVTR